MKIGIIGGGAAGMMAALAASRNKVNHVTILEHKEMVGKKITATGNGKCNFTNMFMEENCFRGDLELLKAPLKAMNEKDLVSFMAELGVYAKNRKGYMYPYSETAGAVRKAFELALKREAVQIELSSEIKEAKKEGDTFHIVTNHNEYEFDALVIATGLLASPSLGSDGSAFPIIEGFGHSFTDIYPALTGFEAEGFNFEAAAGVRAEGKVSLYVDNEIIADDFGEIQFAEYGLSGIPIFQISSFAVRALGQGKKCSVSLDLFSHFSKEALFHYLKSRKEFFTEDTKLSDYFNGLLNPKLAGALCSLFYISQKTKLSNVDDDMLDKFASTLKNIKVDLLKVRGFDNAQVCAGGICTDEIKVDTLESKLVSNLYFAGELLNIDGKCGGYNLQWAFSSGYLAGLSASKG